VSFFITARLAGQDTREAFIEVLLAQLAELSGADLPGFLSETTREAYLLNLLTRTARALDAYGELLVLVVDGLDEERSVTAGPGAHSIAGLLPGDPPAGMRVIVAGRPNPPIPDDVPDWHPLRNPAIVRPLTPSDYAHNMQRLGKREVRRLLEGTETEQGLLGLLTAARGGLSGPDLAELTRVPLWQVEDVLHTVAGRTFTRRGARWNDGQQVYLLGHEELQVAAATYLAGSRLIGYQHQLHAWADTYREQGWPAGTPEYLLLGYYQLLTTLADLPRVVAAATDTARHDRMLDLSGGDAAALTQTRTALELIAAQQTPDLGGALRLVYHRDQLTDRNTNIHPTSRPSGATSAIPFAPKPSRAPLPSRVGRPRRWRRWPGSWRRPDCTSAPARSPLTPSRSRAPSPSRPGRYPADQHQVPHPPSTPEDRTAGAGVAVMAGPLQPRP